MKSLAVYSLVIDELQLIYRFGLLLRLKKLKIKEKQTRFPEERAWRMEFFKLVRKPRTT